MAGGGGAGLSGSVGLGISSCESAHTLVEQTASSAIEQQDVLNHAQVGQRKSRLNSLPCW